MLRAAHAQLGKAFYIYSKSIKDESDANQGRARRVDILVFTPYCVALSAPAATAVVMAKKLRRASETMLVGMQLLAGMVGAAGSTGLLSTVQLAHTTPDGRLRVPSSTRSVLIEIGCSDFHTMDVEELARYPDAFLVSFEPLLDKYAVLLARGRQRYMHDAMHRPSFTKWAPKGEEAFDKTVPLAASERQGQKVTGAPVRSVMLSPCSR